MRVEMGERASSRNRKKKSTKAKGGRKESRGEMDVEREGR